MVFFLQLCYFVFILARPMFSHNVADMCPFLSIYCGLNAVYFAFHILGQKYLNFESLTFITLLVRVYLLCSDHLLQIGTHILYLGKKIKLSTLNIELHYHILSDLVFFSLGYFPLCMFLYCSLRLIFFRRFEESSNLSRPAKISIHNSKKMPNSLEKGDCINKAIYSI